MPASGSLAARHLTRPVPDRTLIVPTLYVGTGKQLGPLSWVEHPRHRHG